MALALALAFISSNPGLAFALMAWPLWLWVSCLWHYHCGYSALALASALTTLAL